MQKPRFRTAEKASWVFIHTRLRPPAHQPTVDRRTAHRSGYLIAASRVSGRAESELPLPYRGETVAVFVKRVMSPSGSSGR